jgi:two-component SAPR family response regulator
MPLISGAEAIRQAREIRPDIPAVILTGYAEAASISGRPNDVYVLLKPFKPEQLAELIERTHRPVAVAAE